MNRRAFIQNSVAAGLAPMMASAQSKDTIRTGMIGTGLRGQHTLGQLMKQPGVTMAAVCDLKPDRLDKAASITARDNPKTYREYRQLLDQKDLDAVFIDTPCYLHSEMAIAALQAGKNVYCEKPVGITPQQVEQITMLSRARRCSPVAPAGLRCFPAISRRPSTGLLSNIRRISNCVRTS